VAAGLELIKCGDSLTAAVDKPDSAVSFVQHRKYSCVGRRGEARRRAQSETLQHEIAGPANWRGCRKMGMFKRTVPRHYIPIHPDNIGTKDWIILLEAGTIVGRSPEKLRVAAATLERKIVTKYNLFLKKKHFLVLEGYDPRIHALYFCPQLYKLDSDNKPIALDGDEIGKLLAQSVRDGVVVKRPWYEPSETLPQEPIVAATMNSNFESLVVEESSALKSAA
jgi:hypothetical protein